MKQYAEMMGDSDAELLQEAGDDEGAALEIKRAESGEAGQQGSGNQNLQPNRPTGKQANGEQMPVEPMPAPSADVGGEQAMDAMSEPAPAAEMGGDRHPPASTDEVQRTGRAAQS